ncbi:MAG: hypothetical protein J6A95_07155 [Clostridia bacterium]|nr:hypothetical protein [Clostridia bacterium]
MVTLEQYKIKYRELYKRMERVRNLASALSDGRFWFGATSFKLEIKKYMETIESVYNAYTTAPSFKNKDFTEYLKKFENEVKDKEEYLIKVTAISEANKKAGY